MKNYFFVILSLVLVLAAACKDEEVLPGRAGEFNANLNLKMYFNDTLGLDTTFAGSYSVKSDGTGSMTIDDTTSAFTWVYNDASKQITVYSVTDSVADTTKYDVRNLTMTSEQWYSSTTVDFIGTSIKTVETIDLTRK